MAAAFSSVLLDTSIWIDLYLGYRAGSETARRLVETAIEMDIGLLYAPTSSKDVFYIVAADYKRSYRRDHGGSLSEGAARAARQTAWACVDNMAELGSAVGCDESDVWFARKQRGLHPDFEDDLVIAAAVRADAGCVVTNDRELVQHSPVAALTCEDALAYLHAFGNAADRDRA